MPRVSRRPALALLGALALLCLVACGPTATASVSPTATETGAPVPTATPSPTPEPDWQGFTDPKFGFRLDVPGALWVDPNGQPSQQSATDSMTPFVFHTLRGVPRSQYAALFDPSGILQVYASTAPGQCQLQGTPVAVGGGITGYRDDTFAHPPTSGSYVPFGSVSFMTGGLYVSLWVSANDAASHDQYWTSFGPAWQHMLASFVPGPAIPNGHPCG